MADNSTISGALDEMKVLEANSKEQAVNNAYALGGMIGDIMGKFNRCKMERLPHESRMLRQYHNFRGKYGEDTKFRDSENSRVFVKITKTKVMAAYGQIMEILFQGNKFPLSVEAADKAEGIAEYAHLDPNPEAKPTEELTSDIYGWSGDGREIAPGTTYSDLMGGLQEKYEEAKLVAGPSPDPKGPQIEPAKEAAMAMEKTIHDQINEADGHIWLRKAILEMAMLGTGVVKGPFSTEKTVHKWVKSETPDEEPDMDDDEDDDGPEMVYMPEKIKVPSMGWCSVWNFYPDPDARTIKEAEWVIERHKMSATDLRALAKRPYFIKEAITSVLINNPNYIDEHFEWILRDSQVNTTINRYEVIEYWGMLDKDLVEDAGIELGVDLEELEEVQVNVWLCNNQILRCVLNPFTPAMIPYHASPYEEHEYQLWGVGVAENMEDSQEIMNAFARLAIDNAVLAGSLVFDIDEQALVPGQDMKIHPGKIFRRVSGQPGQAVFGLKFPNTAEVNMQIFDRFRQISDESTGIPSYSHGQTGVTSTTRTSSGLSMLMGAAALNIKSVVKNIDDFILQPLGEAFFHWNMQFNPDQGIKGDLHIKARGTSGLMAKEVMSQRLMQFLQFAANPALAPFIKAENIVRKIAVCLDLDPDEITNNSGQAAIYAQIMAMAGGIQGGSGQMGSMPKMDMNGTGGGNIGTGSAPQSGESGFTGTPGGQGNSANAESAG